MADPLIRFVTESNAIEGIHRQVLWEEVEAHERFLEQEIADAAAMIDALAVFVAKVQPGATLRAREGMNVRVGPHVAPPGGPQIPRLLKALLEADQGDPWRRHCAYETLHPFMDGNGRSGRVLWLREMGGIESVPLGFLHTFYYQTLQRTDR